MRRTPLENSFPPIAEPVIQGEWKDDFHGLLCSVLAPQCFRDQSIFTDAMREHRSAGPDVPTSPIVPHSRRL